MDRICPACKTELSGYSYFYCNSCGLELPKELVNQNRSKPKVVDMTGEKESFAILLKRFYASVKHFFSIVKPLYFVAILLIFIFGGSLYSYVNLMLSSIQSSSLKIADTGPVYTSKNVLTSKSDYTVNVFGADKITEYVPYDVDLFIEGHDLNAVLSQYAEYDNVYINLYNEVKTSVSPHFGIFASNDSGSVSWGFIIFPVNLNMQEFGTMMRKNYSWLNYAEVGKAIIISPEKRLIELSESTFKKETKNLALSPKYAASKNFYLKNGKFLVLCMNEGGKLNIQALSKLKFSNELVAVLKIFAESGLDFAVII